MRLISPIAITPAILASSSIAEDEYPPYSSVETCALGVRRILNHVVYESLQASNTNHNPEAESATPVWWLRVGATNRWRAFDDSPSLQSSAAESVTFSLVPGTRANAIALLNLSATSVHVAVTSAADGLVYDRTISLVGSISRATWYAYFFDPIKRRTDLVLRDLPSHRDATIAVTISNPGATAAIGECVIGRPYFLGKTLAGLQLGIQDYSVKKRDDFGNYTVLERAFNRRAVGQVYIEASRVDDVHALLASYRAQPIVYWASDQVDASIVYGFYKDFSIEIPYPEISLCSLEIEGLI